MRGIAKRFGAVQALCGVDFACAGGEVHALLGENGAGKTTLMHVLFGLVGPDAGTIALGGREVTLRSPRDAIGHGLGMVHQHFTQVPRLTVAENVWLGRPGLRFDRGAARATVRRVGEATGLVLDPDAPAGELAVGLRQRLEIVKALSRQVRVLILDEPTAALTPGEVDQLFASLRTLRGRGMAIVLITHKLREATALADRVTVLRCGEVVLHAPAEAAGADALAAAMIGPEAGAALRREVVQERVVTAPAAGGDVAAAVRDLSVSGRGGRAAVRHVSFDIRRGEVVGVAAVEGNGQRELLRALAGLSPYTGTVSTKGETGFVPEDREREGLVQDFSVPDNLLLGAPQPFVIDRRHLEHMTASMVEEFAIAGDPRQPVRTLSGGNQQKVVLARVLSRRPALLVAENPTRGLDIGATADVHQRIRRAAAEGAGVLLYSTDLDEILAVSDRVAVMSQGTWREVPAEQLRRDVVGAMMVGAA